MSLVFVSNPVSGSADDEVLRSIEKRLRQSHDVIPFVASSADAFGEELRKAAESSDLVVVAGGDGTLSHSVNALVDRRDEVTFASIPLGTGNDLARTLGLNASAVELASGSADGRMVELDLGRATSEDLDRFFANACVGGFSVQVDQALRDEEKHRLGAFAFWLGGLRAARSITRYSVRINDLEIEEAVAVGIGNGRSVGGGLEMWPEARPDDGLLDACVISAPGPIGGLKAAVKVKAGTHEEDENVTAFEAARIEVEAEPRMEFNVDGELIGLGTPAVFEIVGKFRMLLPPEANSVS